MHFERGGRVSSFHLTINCMCPPPYYELKVTSFTSFDSRLPHLRETSFRQTDRAVTDYSSYRRFLLLLLLFLLGVRLRASPPLPPPIMALFICRWIFILLVLSWIEGCSVSNALRRLIDNPIHCHITFCRSAQLSYFISTRLLLLNAIIKC